METILEKILDAKKKRLAEAKSKMSYDDLLKRVNDMVPLRHFRRAIAGKDHISIIGEAKKASPSKGELIEHFDACEIGELYYNNGVKAISVLTEQDYFKGDLHLLSSVKYCTEIPLLRKDFIFDEYQIVESRVFQADAILLICRILEPDKLKKLIFEADELNLESLVEVHDRDEINKALDAGARILGINNRDLADFSIDINKTLELVPSIPSSIIVVSESGFIGPEDIRRVAGSGVDAVLIGEAFMRSDDMRGTVREFVEYDKEQAEN